MHHDVVKAHFLLYTTYRVCMLKIKYFEQYLEAWRINGTEDFNTQEKGCRC